jgi:tight adherence protein B
MNANVLIAVVSGLAALLLVVGLYVWFDRRTIARDAALRQRLGALAEKGRGEAVTLFREAKAERSSLQQLLDNARLKRWVEAVTTKDGAPLTLRVFLRFVGAGILLGVIAAFFVGPLSGILIALAGGGAPFAYVAQKHSQRGQLVESQLPEAVDMLVNALRAGYALPAAMNFVGNEVPAPLGPEFVRFYDEQRLGIDVRQALHNLQESLGTLDARMFVLAIMIQRETGGNLSEILMSIATVIRERVNFREQVKVLTAEANMSAVILSALPVVMYIMIRVLNPTYAAQMTTTDTGRLMLLYGAVSIAVGYVVLKRIAKVEM